MITQRILSVTKSLKENMFNKFLVFILLIQLFSFELVFSSEYIRPNKYFINCGSKSNTNSSNGRTFIGDSNPSLSFSTGNSEPVEDKNPSPNTQPLYKTARVYKRRDSYELEVEKTSTYIVRLHFFPFSSPSFNLSDAVFNVSASGFSLLSNFGFKNGSSALQVEEFLLSVSERTFSLYFVPSQDSSFAFVNAIEVFPAPERFVPSSASRVASSRSNGTFTGLSALVLRTVHRINVGGKKITPENDTLWRTWIEDDDFLLGSKTMSIGEERINGGELVYNPKLATNFIAPDYVYNTARILSSASNFSKMGWDFRVSKEVKRHFVRLHFCDVASQAIDSFNFSLSIYDGFRTSIDPYRETRSIATPFFLDFVVDSGGSRSINVSISLEPQNAQNPIAFLNGLEIFEIWNVSGLVPPLRPKKKNKDQQGILIGLVVGSVVACVSVVGLLIAAFFFYKKRTSKTRISRFNFGVFVSGETSWSGKSSGFSSSLNLSLKIPFAHIEKATQNFDEDLLLGVGGFGRVYRGLLKGTNVAVKRGKPRSGQGIEEFQTEIMVLSRICHRRLLSLIGYCNEMSEMILVYEFMEKGTLREHLYGSSSSGGLSWEKRLEICIGAAEGLEYLHTGLPEVVLHHDVKSTNILLDERFSAKVADFGLSKLGSFDPDDDQLEFVKGSFGYFDPEYTMSSIYTEQSDVYSFGVVLLEVLCARPAILEDNVNLAKWAMDRKRNGTIKEIVDRSLIKEIEGSSLRVFGDIAEKCLRERGVDRPSMKDVVYDLNYALKLHRGTTRGEPFDEDTATNLAFPYSFAGLREEEEESNGKA